MNKQRSSSLSDKLVALSFVAAAFGAVYLSLNKEAVMNGELYAKVMSFLST